MFKYSKVTTINLRFEICILYSSSDFKQVNLKPQYKHKYWIKRPYFASQKSYTIDASVAPRYDHYQQNSFCDEAMNSVAKFYTEKLAKHSDSFSFRIGKENYSKLAE